MIARGEFLLSCFGLFLRPAVSLGWFSLRQLMAGGQDGRATSLLSLNDIQRSRNTWHCVTDMAEQQRSECGCECKPFGHDMMKDPWPLRILNYVSGCITPGHSIIAGAERLD